MKPSVRTALLSDVTACLAFLAVLPYELGEMANVLPPDVKKWVAIIGAISTALLRLFKRFQEAAEKAVEDVAVVDKAADLAAKTAKANAPDVIAIVAPTPVPAVEPPKSEP